MFVIARLVELMQALVNTEDDKEDLEQRLKDVNDVVSKKASSETTDITSTKESAPLRKRTVSTSNEHKED